MAVRIPSGENTLTVEANGRRVALTNLEKVYFPPLLLKRGRFDLASYPRTARARV